MEWKEIIAGLSLFFSVVSVLYARYTSGQDLHKKALDVVSHKASALEARLSQVEKELDSVEEVQHRSNSLESRLTQVEMAIKSLPTKDAFHNLEIMVTKLEGESRSQGKELSAIAAMLTRMESWLLDTKLQREGQLTALSGRRTK